MIVTMGININDSKKKWSELLLSGQKSIETRGLNRLKKYAGQIVGVIRTGVGRPEVVGFIRLGPFIEYKTLDHFRADTERHCIEPGSKFDWAGRKFGYPVEVIQVLDKPIPVTSKGISTRKIQPYEIHQK